MKRGVNLLIFKVLIVEYKHIEQRKGSLITLIFGVNLKKIVKKRLWFELSIPPSTPKSVATSLYPKEGAHNN